MVAAKAYTLGLGVVWLLQVSPPSALAMILPLAQPMMAPSTRAYVLFVSASRVRRIKAASWAYPPELLELLARTGVRGATVRTIPGEEAYERITGGNRNVLCIEPAARRLEP